MNGKKLSGGSIGVLGLLALQGICLGGFGGAFVHIFSTKVFPIMSVLTVGNFGWIIIAGLSFSICSMLFLVLRFGFGIIQIVNHPRNDQCDQGDHNEEDHAEEKV